MCIGVKIIEDKYERWSVHNGEYWTDYVTNWKSLILDIKDGGNGMSGYQDYTPVLTPQLHRWNDDSRD